jgi:hypothetical protein
LLVVASAILVSLDWVGASRALHEYRQDPNLGCLRVELWAAANWLPALLLTFVLAQNGGGDEKESRAPVRG